MRAACVPREPPPRAAAGMLLAVLCLFPDGQRAAAWAGEPGPDQAEEDFTLDGRGRDADRAGSSFWGRLRQNLRLDLDVIARVGNSREGGRVALFGAMGLDLHKVFSGRSGDIGTLVLQPYIVYRDGAPAVSSHDHEHEELQFDDLHDIYFNLTRWGRGRTNVKVGHFDLPFGLEPNVDTHFTLHQLTAMANLGTKKDWGLSLNGTPPGFDYEISLTRGSGMRYDDAGKNFALTGRVGTPWCSTFVLGASAFLGRMLDEMGVMRWRTGLAPPPGGGRGTGSPREEEFAGRGIVERVRAGTDASWIRGPLTLRGELSAGRDFDQDVFNALFEIRWTHPAQRLHGYLQATVLGQRGFDGWDEDVVLRLGGVWRIDDRWSLSLQYSQELATFGPRGEKGQVTLQLRWTF